MAGWQDAPIVRPAPQASGGGWQDAPIVKPAPGSPYDETMFAQATSGLNEGIGNALGAPVDMATWALNLGGSGINAAFGTNLQPIQNPALGSEQINQMMGNAGAIRPESADTGNQIARRIAQDVGAAIPVVGGLSAAGRLARPLSATASELTMAAGSGTGAAVAEQVAPDNMWAELAGQILGAGGVGLATAVARRAVTPFPTSPERLAQVDTLRREGVELTAGQATGNKGLQYAESELGGARIADLTEQQAEQFTSAALRRIGENARRATPEVLDGAYRRIGNDFEQIGARNTIRADSQMAADLRAAWQEYAGVTSPSDRAPNIERFITEIAEAIRNNNGVLDGRTYTSLRSRLGALGRSASNSERQDAYYGIQRALDDAMERNMSPDDVEMFRNARREYRDFIVIEQAATGAGENAAMGLISPAQLRQATVSKHGRRNYARGQGDFPELARAGVSTMTPLPQSGTAPRNAVRNLMMAGPSILGAGVGGSVAHIPGAIAGAAAGAAIPSVVARAMLSRPGQSYLANQLLPAAAGRTGRGVGPVAAMVAGQSSGLGEVERAMMEQLYPPPKAPLQITVGSGRR